MNNEELAHLSKKQQRKLKQQQEFENLQKQDQRKTFLKWGIGIGVVILFAGGLWWLVQQSSKPLPGESIADLGREHVTDISGIKYNSNPPTSGSHFPLWAQRGVYKQVLSDGYLIHSLEHGYIVISYNCDKKAPVSNGITYKKDDPMTQQRVLPSGGKMTPFQPSNPPAKDVDLPKGFTSKECSELVGKLAKFLDKYHRVVIVPRVNLDTELALTAWNHIEKLNTLDESKIDEFIKAYENKGPEQTVE